MEKSQKEDSDNMKARMKIWKQALAMCNDDRDSFVAELKATQKTIKAMSEPVKFSTKMTKFTIGSDLTKYLSSIKKADMGKVTDDEKADNKAALAKFIKDVKDGKAEAEEGFKKASDLKAVLIK